MFGNPPFGTRGAFVKIFIKEGLKNCPFIGLIVPNSFLKVKKNVNNKEYQILDTVALDSKGYTLLEEDYEVNTHFAIFANNQDKFEPIKEITIEEKTEPTIKPTEIDFRGKLMIKFKDKLDENLESFVKKGEIEKIIDMFKNLNKYKQELSLNSVEWAEFVVEDLFEIEVGKNIPNNKLTIGQIPIIKATAFNNGVATKSGSINNQSIFINKITVASHGEPGVAFYHNYKFMTSNNILILDLKNKELNKYIGLFLTTTIEKLKPKYSYGKVLSMTRLKSEKIWLPIDSDGKPNYQFMEDYIKSLSFSEILD